MALENEIAKLVEAANDLTGTVDNKIQQIDRRVAVKEQEVDKAISDLSVLGDGGQGSTVVNAANFFTSKPGVTASCYLHFKLPFKTDFDHAMFHLHMRGYAYGEAKIVDATLVGYCYKPSDNVINVDCVGSHEPILYKGSDNVIYGRMYFPTQYYLTVVVDTTRVGNGRVLRRGEVEIIMSDKEFL